jgi:NADP-dependent alcohol dehydrogenase
MVWLMPHVMEQLTYPHEGYLQDRIAEFLQIIEVGPKVVKTQKITL